MSAIGIGYAIYKHKNPAKAVENAAENISNAGKKTEPLALEAKKPTENVVEKKTQEAERLAKEAEERAAKEAELAEQERLTKEAQKAEEDRLAKEAQQKAEKEAVEEKVVRMKKDLSFYAKGIIESVHEAWQPEAGRLVRLFEKADKEGFETLKGTKAVLSDGTQVISHSNGKSSPYTYTYLSKDGKTLDEIIAFKDGKKLYSAQLDNPNHTGYYETVAITKYRESKNYEPLVFNFTRDSKNPKFVEWHRYSEPHEGVITHIKRANDVDGMANYEVTFFRSDGLGDRFWIKQPV